VAIMLIVLVLSSIWNLVYAVGIGLVIASLMFMKKIGDLTAEHSVVKTLKERSGDDELDLPNNFVGKVFIKNIKGPLFFGSTSDFQQLSQQIPDSATTVIIRMERMLYIDQSGLYALEDVLTNLVQSGKIVLLVRIPKQPRYMLERIDIIPDLIPLEWVVKDFRSSLHWIKEHADEVVRA
jgi:SulP family sulfate permease